MARLLKIPGPGHIHKLLADKFPQPDCTHGLARGEIRQGFDNMERG